jgi:hypothetical protein
MFINWDVRNSANNKKKKELTEKDKKKEEIFARTS